MEEKKAQFLPFHAINEFMRDDYRLTVVRSVMNALASLPEGTRAEIDRMTRKYVQVPGFRNSAKAPPALRVKPTIEAFEKRPQVVAAILSAWAELNAALRQQVFDLLISRDWTVLPPEADRTRLPGFITRWPKRENFDLLNKAFSEKYPDQPLNNDDISLMVVWLSTRLPFQEEGADDRGEIEAAPAG